MRDICGELDPHLMTIDKILLSPLGGAIVAPSPFRAQFPPPGQPPYRRSVTMQGQCHRDLHFSLLLLPIFSCFIVCSLSRVSMFMIKHNRGCLVSSNHGMEMYGIKSFIWRKLIVYLVFALWSVVKELKHHVTWSDAVSVQGDTVLWQPVIGIIAAPPQLELLWQGGAAHLLNTWDMSLDCRHQGRGFFTSLTQAYFNCPRHHQLRTQYLSNICFDKQVFGWNY